MLSTSFFAAIVVVLLSSTHDSIAQSVTSTTAAQPTSAPGQCIIKCVQPAAQAVGCSFTDIPCVCASAEFQRRARKCLEDTCSPEELQQAISLQTEECGAIGVSASSITSESTTATTVSGVSSTPTTPTSNSSSRPSRPSSSVTSSTATSNSPPAGSPSNAALHSAHDISINGAAGLAGILVAGLVALIS